MFSSQAALPSISVRACVYIYLCCQRVSLGLSGAIHQGGLSLCLRLAFHTAYQAREHLVLLLDGVFEAAGASTRGISVRDFRGPV